MTLDDYRRTGPAPLGLWRRRARETILRVLDEVGEREATVVLAAVDAAYPFVSRSRYPYKAWLWERRTLIDALAIKPTLPSKDEADVCEVARDAVLEGKLDLARQLLDQAPNRLARKCPACGAWPRGECKTMPSPDGAQRCTCASFASSDDIAAAPLAGQECPGCGAAAEYLIVPHHARLVGHLDAGPLFGGEP